MSSNFLEKLYFILENHEYEHIIAWQPDGNSFIIKNTQLLEERVLPLHFKHNNCNSFIRQLNMYNFSKTRHDSNYREFRQSLFRRDRKDLLCLIKRKTQNNTNVTFTPTTQSVEEWEMQTDMDCHVASTDLCNLANQSVVKDEHTPHELISPHELKGMVMQLQQQVSYLQFQYDNLLTKHNELNQFVRANMANSNMEAYKFDNTAVSHSQQQQLQSPAMYGASHSFHSVYPPNPYMNHDVKVSIPVNVNIMCPAKISPTDCDVSAMKKGRTRCESSHEELVQTVNSLAGKPLQRMPASWPLPDSTTQEVETAKALVSMVSVDGAYN